MHSSSNALKTIRKWTISIAIARGVSEYSEDECVVVALEVVEAVVVMLGVTEKAEEIFGPLSRQILASRKRVKASFESAPIAFIYSSAAGRGLPHRS